jgi:hypothetical protein
MNGVSVDFYFILMTHIFPLCAFAVIGWGTYLLLRRQEDGSRLLVRGKSTMLCLLVPGAISLVLFYSLAFHMHQSLGKFPEVIGDRVFSPSLKLHGDWALGYFGCLFFFSLFACPFLVFLSATIKGIQPFAGYVAAVGISFWISFGLTFLAPADFLYWWWD